MTEDPWARYRESGTETPTTRSGKLLAGLFIAAAVLLLGWWWVFFGGCGSDQADAGCGWVKMIAIPFLGLLTFWGGAILAIRWAQRSDARDRRGTDRDV